jgi:glucan phosphoethanolaminetransferase (alkaline phosphatase superfamily)
MTSLYVWLKFVHLAGLGAFLFGHGIAGGASLALRAKPTADISRALLQLSIWSYRIAYPGLFLLLATGVWMGFAGSWWGRGWIWASIAVLVLVFGLMSFVSVAYHKARDSAKEGDSVLAERLDRTRPVLAVWIGAIGILALLFLMVFKPF